MYISELKVENFRLFGEGENAVLPRLRPGLTASIGEDGSGKTVIVIDNGIFHGIDTYDYRKPRARIGFFGLFAIEWE